MEMDKKRAPATAHQEKGDCFQQACMVLLVVVCIILISLTIMPNGRPEQGDAPTQSIVPHSGLPSKSKAISPDSESASQSPEQQAYVLNLNSQYSARLSAEPTVPKERFQRFSLLTSRAPPFPFIPL